MKWILEHKMSADNALSASMEGKEEEVEFWIKDAKEKAEAILNDIEHARRNKRQVELFNEYLNKDK